MAISDLIYEQTKKLSDHLAREVLDFVGYVAERQERDRDLINAQEAVLRAIVFERGDLVLIPFPFSDLSATKKRPVLLPTCPGAYGDFIGLPVTSRPQTDRGIALDPTDLMQGGLLLASWICVDRVVTLNASLIVKAFGRISETVHNGGRDTPRRAH